MQEGEGGCRPLSPPAGREVGLTRCCGCIPWVGGPGPQLHCPQGPRGWGGRGTAPQRPSRGHRRPRAAAAPLCGDLECAHGPCPVTSPGGPLR